MAKTVIALYDNLSDGQAALQDLVNSGFSNRDISLMRRHEGEGREVDSGNEAAEGAGIGAGIGAVLGGAGGLLVGLGLLTIPGVGPVLAAGPLAAALAGAGVGAAGGALVGALVGLGVPEGQAQYYAEGVRRGSTLVAVKADSAMTEMASSVLRRHNPVNIDQRAESWRAEGWTAFDEQAAPYERGYAGEPRGDIVREGITYEEEVIGETGAVRETRERDLNMDFESGVTSTDRSDPGAIGGADYGRADFSGADLDSAYRRHFDSTYSSMGYEFDRYRPAYRYGHDLAEVERNRDLGWEQVEPEARRRWEDRNPGTWESYKDAVRAGFMATRERATASETW